MKIRLFHVTNQPAAEEILANGFKATDRGWGCGNFVSACPLSVSEGAKGGRCLEIVIESTAEQMFYDWEVIESQKPYREWCIPAEVLNSGTIRLLSDMEAEEASAGEYWNDYPPGEPEKTFAELDSEPLD